MRIRFAGAHGGFVAERLFVEMEYSSNCAEHWHLQEMSARLFDILGHFKNDSAFTVRKTKVFF